MTAAWESTVDNGRFTCVVQQDRDPDGYSGTLRVYVTETGEELLNEEVGVMFAARFGPDVADVNDWQQRGLVVIDAWLAEHDETIPEGNV